MRYFSVHGPCMRCVKAQRAHGWCAEKLVPLKLNAAAATANITSSCSGNNNAYVLQRGQSIRVTNSNLKNKTDWARNKNKRCFGARFTHIYIHHSGDDMRLQSFRAFRTSAIVFFYLRNLCHKTSCWILKRIVWNSRAFGVYRNNVM